MNPTHAEVSAILAQYEESLEISPMQLLDLARFAGLEPNFSGLDVSFQALQDLRDIAHERLTIKEVPEPPRTLVSDPREGNLAAYRSVTPPDPPIPEVEPISMRGIINGVLLGAVVWLLIAAVVLVSVYHAEIAAWLARWDG